MSLRVRILQIDVPAAQLDEATAFWAGALGARPVRPPGRFVHLHDAASVVEVHLQPLDDGGPRYHLDLEVPGAGGRDVEVARLAGLGATVGAHSPDGYTVLHDPAGLALCVIEPGAASRNPLTHPRDDQGHLGAIVLDVPEHDRQREVAFWAKALGAEVGDPADGYVPLDGVVGPGGPIALGIQGGEGAGRMHVALSARDSPTEVARLEALGATRVAALGTSTFTLADPVGNLLGVVPTRDGDET